MIRTLLHDGALALRDEGVRWAWAARSAQWLHHLVKSERPHLVLETGVLNGLSSAAILEALEQNADGGRLISVDLPKRQGGPNADGRWDRAAVRIGQTGGLVPRRLWSSWELRLGDSLRLLPQICDQIQRRDRQVQLAHLDSDHSYHHVRRELELVWSVLSPTGLVVVDDADWSRATEEFADGKGVPVSWAFGRHKALLRMGGRNS